MKRKFTDDEILSTLKRCTADEHSCVECPYAECDMCSLKNAEDAIDMIERYKEENERLKAQAETHRHMHDALLARHRNLVQTYKDCMLDAILEAILGQANAIQHAMKKTTEAAHEIRKDLADL